MDNVILYAVLANIAITLCAVLFALWVMAKEDVYTGCIMSAFNVIVGVIGHVFARSLELTFAVNLPNVKLSGKLADASINMNILLFVVVLMMLYAFVALILKHQVNMARP